jgi:regulator of replication initiation timing
VLTYEQLENKAKIFQWLATIMAVIAILSYGSSVSTNQQARTLLKENTKLQATNSDLGHNLAQARYELQNAQRDCTSQIEELLYKLDGLKA